MKPYTVKIIALSFLQSFETAGHLVHKNTSVMYSQRLFVRTVWRKKAKGELADLDSHGK